MGEFHELYLQIIPFSGNILTKTTGSKQETYLTIDVVKGKKAIFLALFMATVNIL